MRVLIVDDEPLAVELLRELLAMDSGVDVIGEASSGRAAIKAIRELRPDLVFLDIEMPGINGFQVVESLQADDHMPLIVFATAFDEYAVDAFDVNAVDYVLKPIELSRLKRALARARDRVVDGSKERLLRAIAAANREGSRASTSITDALADHPEALGRLPVRQGDSVQLLELDDIDWVDAAGDYMCVHAQGTTHILRCTMKQLSDRLALGPFARIHRSTLVNLNKIRKITPLTKGECMLHLSEETQLKVSRNYRSNIQHLLS
jgi:two-component system LytT family response regulator